MKKRFSGWLAALLLLALVLPLASVSAAGEKASGELKDKDGKSMGKVSLSQDNTGAVKLSVNYSGLPAGNHGVHFHATGKCDGPDFMTAGGHFNPDNKKHGGNSPDGPHAGDILMNLSAPAGGNGTFESSTNLITLSAGAKSLFDADGAALVIHANADDMSSDPAGNSGARIACTVLSLDAIASLPAAGQGGSVNASGGNELLIIAGLLVVMGGACTTLVGLRRKSNR